MQTSSFRSHCSCKTDICSSSLVICCTSLLFFIASSFSCVCTWLACSCKQRQMEVKFFSFKFPNNLCLTMCTCTCCSSSVRAISVISDGGCSHQMSSPPSSPSLRCSGLDRGARRDRRLYGFVGVVRIWVERWFTLQELKSKKLNCGKLAKNHLSGLTYLNSFHMNSVQFRDLLFFVGVSGFQNILQMSVGFFQVLFFRHHLSHLFSGMKMRFKIG